MQYSIYGAIVPNVSIPAIDVTQYGQTTRISSHSRDGYDAVEVNFTIDNEFNNYWYIWRWLDILNDSATAEYDARNVSEGKPRTPIVNSEQENPPRLLLDYQTDMTLFGLNEYNKNAIKFTYTNAFPVSLGNISYSYRDATEIESSFTFSFTQLLVELL